MIEAACHCGAFRFSVPTDPKDLNACGCSICRRYATLWAYYPPAEVIFAEANGPTDIYMWDDRELEFHRCRACGCVTHWAPIEAGQDRMGVNGRLFPPDVLRRLPIRQSPGPA